MKSVLLAFLLWSCAMVSGALVPSAMAQCSGTQICGSSLVTENVVYRFVAQGNNKSINIGGVIVATGTGGGSGTANDFARAYSGISAGGTCVPANVVANLTCTGTLIAGWTSGAVSNPPVTGDSVTFTSTTPNTNVAPDLTVTTATGAVLPTVTYTQGGAGGLASLLGNKMVCVGNTQVGRTPSGQWYNQEHHAGASSGALTDFKMGPAHAVDPSKLLGSWSIGGTGGCEVSYDYGGGTIYTYNVWQNGANYTFCKISGPAVSPANFTIPSSQIFAAVSPASCGTAP